jgi:hypothetical protein
VPGHKLTQLRFWVHHGASIVGALPEGVKDKVTSWASRS